MDVVVLPAPARPQSNEGFYSINNQFQETGPKGFSECKILENDDLFWRIDLPGVSEESLTLSLDPSKKSVLIDAYEPSLEVRNSIPRRYAIGCRLFCNCCEISHFVSDLSHGVLRLLISKTFLSKALGATCVYRFPLSSVPNDPTKTGPDLKPHSGLKQGPTMAYESTQLIHGSLYVRVDMPGVPTDGFTISVTDGRVKVSGQAPAVSHDSAGRFYSGDVAVLSVPVDLPINRIRSSAKFGVLRLDICPP